MIQAQDKTLLLKISTCLAGIWFSLGFFIVLVAKCGFTTCPEGESSCCRTLFWECKIHQNLILGSLEALWWLSWPLLVRSWGSLGTFKVPLWRVLLYFLRSGNRVTKKDLKSLQNRALRSLKTKLSPRRGANSDKYYFSKKVSILVSILESF